VSLSGFSLSRLAHDRRGATAVEFAFVGAIFVFMLLGVVEFGRYYFTLQSVRSLASEAARDALISANSAIFGGGNCTAQTSTTLTPNTSTIARYPLIRTTNPPLDATWTRTCGSASAAARVTVRIRYDFSFIVPFLPASVAQMDETVFLDFYP
jgi:Flp pilus assembly protein TadG